MPVLSQPLAAWDASGPRIIRAPPKRIKIGWDNPRRQARGMGARPLRDHPPNMPAARGRCGGEEAERVAAEGRDLFAVKVTQ